LRDKLPRDSTLLGLFLGEEILGRLLRELVHELDGIVIVRSLRVGEDLLPHVNLFGLLNMLRLVEDPPVGKVENLLSVGRPSWLLEHGCFLLLPRRTPAALREERRVLCRCILLALVLLRPRVGVVAVVGVRGLNHLGLGSYNVALLSHTNSNH